MKKKLSLLTLLGLIVVLLGVIVFVAPVGTGLHATLRIPGTSKPSIDWTGYTVIFGNKADAWIREAASANVAAFTVLVIGVVFEALATALLIPNPNGSKKFSGFLFVVGGLLELVFGIILLCAKSTTGLAGNEVIKNLYDLHLGVGVILSGAAAIIAAVASVLSGVLAWKKK